MDAEGGDKVGARAGTADSDDDVGKREFHGAP